MQENLFRVQYILCFGELLGTRVYWQQFPGRLSIGQGLARRYSGGLSSVLW
jgi:hypothetical protein